jgi:hypothetical protein
MTMKKILIFFGFGGKKDVAAKKQRKRTTENQRVEGTYSSHRECQPSAKISPPNSEIFFRKRSNQRNSIEKHTA